MLIGTWSGPREQMPLGSNFHGTPSLSGLELIGSKIFGLESSRVRVRGDPTASIVESEIQFVYYTLNTFNRVLSCLNLRVALQIRVLFFVYVSLGFYSQQELVGLNSRIDRVHTLSNVFCFIRFEQYPLIITSN